MFVLPQANIYNCSVSFESDLLYKRLSGLHTILPVETWFHLCLQAIDAAKKNGGVSTSYQSVPNTSVSTSYQSLPNTAVAPRPTGKTLGMSRRGVRGSFIPPMRGANGASAGGAPTPAAAAAVPRGNSSAENGQEEATRKW